MIERGERGAAVVLRMAHGKANAMDTEFLEALASALAAEERSGARAVILTGKGSIFSAGVDLRRVADGGRAYLESFLPALSACFARLFAAPLPVIAAVNGHAIAGGCVVACACDHRLMAAGTGRIGVPELVVGVPFPLIALEILRFALPRHRIQEAVYGGATYEPAAALERGFVDEVVEAERLLDRTAEVAERLAAIPARSFRMTKAVLRRPALEAWERLGPRDEAEVLAAWTSDEVERALRDYVARTLRR